ncbi:MULTISPECIES: hypothetical protein [Actinoplanes]|uniref:hypothetical protein n=1 Tax=Actinoplanes TaxID=1865 RepID=UPI0005F2C32C|nr:MULTISPECIES: hypothetical protein [Actinoplanes]GLY08647.1 hypothetical protein Acsp01_90260 [Actinoplanes sp. NBRC 101535]
MVFFDDADAVTVQHPDTLTDRKTVRGAASRLAAGVGAASLMLLVLLAAGAATVAITYQVS